MKFKHIQEVITFFDNCSQSSFSCSEKQSWFLKKKIPINTT